MFIIEIIYWWLRIKFGWGLPIFGIVNKKYKGNLGSIIIVLDVMKMIVSKLKLRILFKN